MPFTCSICGEESDRIAKPNAAAEPSWRRHHPPTPHARPQARPQEGNSKPPCRSRAASAEKNQIGSRSPTLPRNPHGAATTPQHPTQDPKQDLRKETVSPHAVHVQHLRRRIRSDREAQRCRGTLMAPPPPPNTPRKTPSKTSGRKQ